MKNNLFNPETANSIKAVQKTYGIQLGRLVKLMNGKDEAYAKEVGQSGREGRFVKAVEPQLRKDLIDTIEGTDLQNKLLTDIINKGVAGTKANEQQQASLELGEQKLTNFRTEKAYDFIESKRFEASRHSQEMNYLQTKWGVDNAIRQEDERLKMWAVRAKPELKQLEADEKERIERVKHYLTYGDASRVDLLPQANYEKTSIGGFIKRFVNFFMN